MSTTPIKDGGTAFPMVIPQELDGQGNPRTGLVVYDGMSLRDWFAGQALNGFMSAESYRVDTPSEWANERAAAWMYEMADAMIAAREAKP